MISRKKRDRAKTSEQRCNRSDPRIGSKCTPIPCIGIGSFFRSNPDLSDDWDQLGRSDTSRVGTWYRYRPSRSKDSPILYCGPPTLFGTGSRSLLKFPSLRFVCVESDDPPPLVASLFTRRRVGLGIDRTPPGLPHSSFPAAALRFVAGYLIWRPPTLVASPFKRRVVLGLERTPPGLHHSLFPGCPPICWCFAGRAAAAAAVVALGVVGSTWYPPPTTFICFSRCARQLVRA
ncbi:hypothetical protein PGT21_030948 [Puccinia graminis f. sp. tritici]|uniref:Uncharacterized protein n=1 Tax=Puccinia graminis f. sp. tritici TaxID=56615 RepID=A0A5B0NS49_PUCGR|nr:hypothetical protein PGT21_030948 [Puccinia graminis f. sp. tritici]